MYLISIIWDFQYVWGDFGHNFSVTEQNIFCISEKIKYYSIMDIILTNKAEGMEIMYETFGECLSNWMAENGYSAQHLAQLTGQRSKTSILRLEHDQCTLENCRRFYVLLRSQMQLDATERERFERALHITEYGKECLQFADRLRHGFGRGYAEGRVALIPELQTADEVDVLCFGCLHKAAYALLHELLKRSKVNIRHCLPKPQTKQDVLRMLPTLELLTERRYTAVVPQVGTDAYLPWNTLLVRARHGASETLYNAFFTKNTEEGYSATLFELAAQGRQIELVRELMSQEIEPLFASDAMSRGNDYIRLLLDCYTMEKNTACAIMRPMLCMQMFPVAYLKKAFEDKVTEHMPMLTPAIESMAYVFQRRFENYLQTPKPCALILEQESMEQFAETGLLSDHFIACRPFTPEERRETLKILLKQTERPQFHLYFTKKGAKSEKGGGLLETCSVEIYQGKGVLLYPSHTAYYTDDTNRFYREIFLDAPAAIELFGYYIQQYVIGELCLGQVESAEVLRKLILQI